MIGSESAIAWISYTVRNSGIVGDGLGGVASSRLRTKHLALPKFEVCTSPGHDPDRNISKLLTTFIPRDSFPQDSDENTHSLHSSLLESINR